MRHPPAGRWGTRCHRLGVIAVMTGTLVLVAVPAQAHDALLGSEPADAAVLTDAPTQVVLTFAGPQAEIGAEVVVTGPDGAAWSDGAAVVAGSTVTQPLKGGLPGGAYVVQWRSVAGDGHPVDGTFSFTLDPPILPTTPPVEPEVVIAAPAETPTETPAVLADLADDPDEPPSFVPWLAGGALLAVVSGFALVWVSRRRST